MQTIGEELIESLYERACRCIPGGVNSPVRAFYEMGTQPLMAARGAGAWIWDHKGRRYLDLCMSWGALPFGHAHPAVVEAACAQISRGSSFGLATEGEVRLAEKVCSHYPSIDKVRFVSSGTEAVMSALRLARGFTGREQVIKFNGHYHGHSDALLVRAGSSVGYLVEASSRGVTQGTVQDTMTLSFGEREELERLLASEKIAAVIVEPVAANMGVVPPAPGYLDFLREVTRRYGTLLIFDEVITGYRVALGGAQELYQVAPDLTCLGKIVGGGFPAAAFGGRGEIMDLLAPLGPVFQAGTLSGNPVAMEAGLATLSMLERPGIYERWWQLAARLTAPLRSQPVALHEVGPLCSIFFGIQPPSCWEEVVKLDRNRYCRFFKFMLNNSVYLPPSAYEAWFPSLVHPHEELDRVADLVKEFIITDS